jgi:DNA-directed RNA polymerase subunit RPC12/RpoP
MTCGAKHTKTQIPDEDWKCPKCGVGADADRAFIIQDSDAASSDDCPLLHEADELGCDNCGFGSTGKAFAGRYAKKAGLLRCEHCKGTGMVKGRG